jgi:hypothetical protein
MNDQRQAIVDALNSVEGIDAMPTLAGPLLAGQAWPAWTSTLWVTPCQLITNWFVFVSLPASMPDITVSAGDELVQAIAEALFPIGQVQRVEPYSWPVDPGQQSIPVLRFTVEV